ncbi:hypothetical protein ACOSP7_014259 [Xanthoceras sorbifolium]
MSYFQELGKCIVEILSDIYLLEHKLITSFCAMFQEICLQVFQQNEIIERRTENIVHLPHNDAIVIMAMIGGVAIYKTMVDNGSSVNVLYKTAFGMMGLK